MIPVRLNSKELIKLLLSREQVKQKDFADILTEKTGKKYTAGSLSQKIGRRTISYDEVALVVDLLGYQINVEKKRE